MATIDAETLNHDAEATFVDSAPDNTANIAQSSGTPNTEFRAMKRKKQTVDDSMRYDRMFVVGRIREFYDDQKRRFVTEVNQIKQWAELERKAFATRERSQAEYIAVLELHLQAGIRVDTESRKKQDELKKERNELRLRCEDLLMECVDLRKEIEDLTLDKEELLERLAAAAAEIV
ncbi:hypothetical protein C8R42DRAFT_648556 [Lentinula raphanica]|nr:hypothetical protein C8R42DRAFT_648556 [Lentinula raphanica]